MSVVIKVENISKQYRLGDVGTGALAHDVNKWWHKIRGKENPYLKIGETNDRATKGDSDYVWALKDINFEVKQGEVLGIIGRNGAGKSTLLKILSKTTTPTTGSIKIKGRIASLLEVGTGFHPELSGRENIFLNGAILGMTKREIKSKFDEIVDFAGVERYIDTPVKRYSSGMYVRLAFGVAAHLESEILIVDEVLAVGDAEFQRKCLGKMKDVSNKEGRTVLFVSHQMDALSRICNNALVMEQGSILMKGDSQPCINYYLKGKLNNSSVKNWYNETVKPGNKTVRLLEAKVMSEDDVVKENFNVKEDIYINMVYEVLENDVTFTHGFNLYSSSGIHILSSHDVDTAIEKKKFSKGIYSATVKINKNFLAEGFHSISLAIMSYDPYIVHFHEMDVLGISIIDSMDADTARGVYGGNFPGLIRPILKWETKNN